MRSSSRSPVEYASVVHFLCGPYPQPSSLQPSFQPHPCLLLLLFSVDSLLHLTLLLLVVFSLSFFFLVASKEKHKKRFIDFRFSRCAAKQWHFHVAQRNNPLGCTLSLSLSCPDRENLSAISIFFFLSDIFCHWRPSLSEQQEAGKENYELRAIKER